MADAILWPGTTDQILWPGTTDVILWPGTAGTPAKVSNQAPTLSATGKMMRP